MENIPGYINSGVSTPAFLFNDARKWLFHSVPEELLQLSQ